MSSELPSFAAQWAQQWKDAAPRLQAIRDEELRRHGDQLQSTNHQSQNEGHRVYERYPERHGMVIMQQWLIRRQLLNRVAGQNEKLPVNYSGDSRENA